MKQFKVAALTAFSHLSKLLVNLFIIKQIALTQGPEGLGLLGNYMNLVAIAGTLAGGGITSGIIKYSAQYTGSVSRQLSFAGSALIYTLISALIAFFLGVIFIKSLTKVVFLNQDYQIYIYFFLFAQFFVSLNNFTYGLINGARQNSLYAAIIISGNLIAVLIAFYAIKYYGFWGAIIAIMAPVICPFIPVFFYSLFQPLCRNLRFDSLKTDTVLLSKFSLMLLFSAICFPVVEMCIRNEIINLIDIEAAGFWQAITKLSSAYLSFYSLFLTFYFVPLISGEQDKSKIFAELKKMILFIGGLFLLMIGFFLSMKSLVIELVFSDKFLAISDLFILQMLGDFFRVIGWVVGFIIVAKALTKIYILSELLQGATFILLASIELRYSSSLHGVVSAYFVTCFIYCVVSLAAFCYVFRSKGCDLVEQ